MLAILETSDAPDPVEQVSLLLGLADADTIDNAQARGGHERHHPIPGAGDLRMHIWQFCKQNWARNRIQQHFGIRQTAQVSLRASMVCVGSGCTVLETASC